MVTNMRPETGKKDVSAEENFPKARGLVKKESKKWKEKWEFHFKIYTFEKKIVHFWKVIIRIFLF